MTEPVSNQTRIRCSIQIPFSFPSRTYPPDFDPANFDSNKYDFHKSITSRVIHTAYSKTFVQKYASSYIQIDPTILHFYKIHLVLFLCDVLLVWRRCVNFLKLEKLFHNNYFAQKSNYQNCDHPTLLNGCAPQCYSALTNHAEDTKRRHLIGRPRFQIRNPVDAIGRDNVEFLNPSSTIGRASKGILICTAVCALCLVFAKNSKSSELPRRNFFLSMILLVTLVRDLGRSADTIEDIHLKNVLFKFAEKLKNGNEEGRLENYARG